MRAIVQNAYGEAEVLQAADIEQPTITDSQVLVAVRAAGMDRGTWHLMAGRPYLIRVIGPRRPRNPVPGLDVAGVVVATGAAVTRFQPGDEVFGMAKGGSFAEFAVAREDRLAHKPASMTFEQAAVTAVSGLTALQGLRDAGRITAGQRVLIIGASGGVGSFAVQLAKSFGAEVTGVCSSSKAEFVSSLGADRVLDYAHDDALSETARYDLILDLGGNTPLSRLRSVLAPNGTLVIAGGENGGPISGGMHRQLGAMLLSPFVKQRLTMLASTGKPDDMATLADLADAGSFTPAIDSSYPLESAADAMRHLVSGEVRGKIAIVV